jgi:hypothetical protein
MHRCLQKLAETYNRPGKDLPYGGYHIIFSGDFNQHPPVNQKPLYCGSTNILSLGDQEKNGRTLWKSVKIVVTLTKQNRFDLTQEGGRNLWEIIDALTPRDTDTRLTRAIIAEILDKLNERVITSDMLGSFMANNPPKIIVLRNELRAPLNATLLLHKAKLAKQKIFVWRSIDVLRSNSAKPTGQIKLALSRLPNNKTGHIPAFGFYFPGIKYRFVDSMFPEIGRANNNTCTGRMIVLNPNEDVSRIQAALDDVSVTRIYLKYPPEAVMVQPDGVNRYDPPTMASVPDKCIPMHCVTASFRVQLPKERHLPSQCIGIKRTGLMLEATEVNTDYFSQGMSFEKDKPYLLHLTLPPKEKITKANILVPISRPRSLDQLHLLTPLWTTVTERHIVIDRVYAAFKPSEDFLTEYKRFAELSKETEDKFARLVSENS